jgi:hypothetical protein
VRVTRRGANRGTQGAAVLIEGRGAGHGMPGAARVVRRGAVQGAGLDIGRGTQDAAQNAGVVRDERVRDAAQNASAARDAKGCLPED